MTRARLDDETFDMFVFGQGVILGPGAISLSLYSSVQVG